MVEAKTDVAPIKPKRERSPSFPFIALKAAIGRLVAFDEYSKRHPVPAKHSGQAWGMKGYTSQAQQTLAALKSFGLIEYQGSGENLVATLSEEGRTYLRAQQESIKQEVLKRVALKPKMLAKYFAVWGKTRPADPICLDQLVLKNGFTEAAAKLFLSVYDDTIAFARLGDGDKVVAGPENGSEKAPEDEDEDGNDENPPPAVKIGDFVQWTCGGQDQFKIPRKVIGMFPDGLHVQVFGSNTGIPMTELTILDAPAPPPILGTATNKSKVDAASSGGQGENEFNVLQAGGRLQITADVDLEGLGQLKELLQHYESILKLMTPKKN